MIQSAKSILLVVSALFPIVDPIGGSPVFLSLTRQYAPETRRVLARRIAVPGTLSQATAAEVTNPGTVMGTVQRMRIRP